MKCEFLASGQTLHRQFFSVVSRNEHIFQLEEIMRKFSQKVVNFLKSEDGPTAVEYAVMLALIVVVCLAAISAIGTSASATFDNIATAIQ